MWPDPKAVTPTTEGTGPRILPAIRPALSLEPRVGLEQGE
jgi:hypothetical protein